jgi:hypothetical protein
MVSNWDEINFEAEWCDGYTKSSVLETETSGGLAQAFYGSLSTQLF